MCLLIEGTEEGREGICFELGVWAVSGSGMGRGKYIGCMLETPGLLYVIT